MRLLETSSIENCAAASKQEVSREPLERSPFSGGLRHLECEQKEEDLKLDMSLN